MTWLQFIASIVQSVAWPLAVVFGLWLVRRHLGALLERMLELHLPGGTKIILRNVLAKNEQIIKQIELPKVETPKQISPPQAEIVDPTARIINAWAQVEEIVRVVGEQFGVHWNAAGLQLIINELRNREQIAPETYNLFQNLRTVRNSVAHARLSPTDSEADQYVSQAEVLKEALLVGNQSTIRKRSS
jgi:hypothetical protein